jgi:beta-glucanase (GH16 family)
MTQPLSLALALAALLAIASSAAAAPAWEWRLTFEEEFEGEALNASRWNVADQMRHGDEELQLYVKDEVYLENGDLVLRTRRREAVWNESRV